jgi:aspartyl-tRNA(Asn)/glutamyl-tRNA(Gln) amidotransferase subunit A
MTDGLADLTLAQAAGLIRTRETSSTELTQAVLDRIAETDHVVRAYAAVTADAALRAAAAADKASRSRDQLAPLHGIPVAVKDNIHVAGTPTEAGSAALRGLVADHDASVVASLRRAGAVIVGKTHMIELALGQSVPPTRNAWNTRHGPGGSSSGSATAVAVRSAYGALGTDTGGSIRVPACLQGVVGLKPSFGRVSRAGVIPMSSTLDHVGPLARTVEDCGILLSAIAGHDPRDPQSADVPPGDYAASAADRDLAGVRIGIDRDYFFDGVDPEYAKLVDAAVGELSALGATLVPVRIARTELVRGVFVTIMLTDMSSHHGHLARDRGDLLDPRTRMCLQFGGLIPGSHYVSAQRARRALRESVRTVFTESGLDALVTPSASETAPEVSDASVNLFERRLRQSLADIVGLPAISVPCGFAPNGLPAGFELYGRPFAEATILRLGRAYQGVTDWPSRPPPVIANLSRGES